MSQVKTEGGSSRKFPPPQIQRGNSGHPSATSNDFGFHGVQYLPEGLGKWQPHKSLEYETNRISWTQQETIDLLER